MKALIFFPIIMGLTVFIPSTNEPITSYEQHLYKLHNQYRTAHNLNPLTWDYELQETARKKSNALKYCYENTGKLYHECPGENKGTLGINDNPDVWTYYPKQYKALGENLTVKYPTPDEAFNALLNSPLHKANIEHNFTTYAVSCTSHNLCTNSFKK